MSRIYIRYALLTALAVLLLLCAEYLGFFRGIDNYTYDLFFRLRGPRIPDGRIVIAAIDEKTLGQLGKWPLPRPAYAKLLDRLREAKCVVFDIVFAESSPGDAAFKAAITRHGRVVLPVYASKDVRAVPPLKTLDAPRTGHIHVDQDVDGVVRSVFHTLYIRGVPVSSVSSAAAEMMTGRPFPRSAAPVQSRNGDGHFFQQDPMRINYYGPPGSVRTVSMADIVSGAVPEAYFRDCALFVGVTAPGIESEILTPFAETGARSSGVEVQATVLANILGGDDITCLGEWARIALAVLLAAVFFLLLGRIRETWGVFGLAAAIIAVVLSAFLLFSLGHIWAGPFMFCAVLILTFLASHAMRLSGMAAKLDAAHERVLAGLRWRKPEGEGRSVKKGLVGFLSIGGMRSKVDAIDEVTGQLMFEKGIVDATLFSGVQGVLLFASSGSSVFINARAKDFLHGMVDEPVRYEQFLATILTVALDEGADEKLAHARETGGPASITLGISGAVPLFLKMDFAVVYLGQEKYLLFVLSDITELKELELRRADQMNIVSHELKQPLTAITGYSELLAMDQGAGQKEYIRRIRAEASRMGVLLKTFLDLARLEAGRQEILQKKINLSGLINAVVERVETQVLEKNMHVGVKCATTLEVVADEQLLSQCLVNLLENAVKYSPPGTPILVEAFREDSCVHIDVKDKGFGIEEEHLAHVFDKFYRVRTEKTRFVAGSGLGLALVKQAVEAMGATVSVRSAIGKGSVFRITFDERKSTRAGQSRPEEPPEKNNGPG